MELTTQSGQARIFLIYQEWFETRICFIAIAFQLCFRVCHQEGQANQDGLKLNGSHQLLVYADGNILGRSVHAIKKNTEALVVASKETGLEVNAGKTKYMVMSQDQNAG